MRTQANAKKDYAPRITPEIVPKAPWRVAEVRPLPEFRLWVRFNDGLVGTVNMAQMIHSSAAGGFVVLRDKELFNQVALEYGAVMWPGGVDLAPDAMHDAISRDGEWVVET